METKTDSMEIEDKVFGRLVGKINPKSIIIDSACHVSFTFTAQNGNVHQFSVKNEKALSKLFSLYEASYRKVRTDIKNAIDSMSYYDQRNDAKRADIRMTSSDFLMQLVKQNDRNIVLLLDEKMDVVSIVSEQHKQLPLSQAFEIVDSIARKKGAVFVKKIEKNGSYQVVYEVGQNSSMSLRVTAHLGRNDALGRAGISFSGGGHIFVCSNMIIPYIDSDIRSVMKGGQLISVKVVHTTNVNERLISQLNKSFDSAKHNGGIVAQRFEEAKTIAMSRTLQEHCLSLIKIKHNLPDCWLYSVKRQLSQEDETLYGLSQALTYVGTHRASDKEIGTTLQKIGGQVVILGNEFVSLITKSLKLKKIEVPTLQSSF